MRAFFASIALLFYCGALCVAEDTIAPAEQRFAAESIEETPDFQQHIMPLLGKLGCNGRSCHGSFQGRGGLQLSLFGYDPKFDHDALVKVETDSGETLVNRNELAKSLLLRIPTDGDAHEGGERFAPGSWEYQLFQAWIGGDARGIEKPRHLRRLEVQPGELVFNKPGEEVQLRVIAHWEEGSSEDVTCLTRFQTNNDAIVSIDSKGHVVAVGQGDSHVVAFYDSGVTAVPVLMPVAELAADRYTEAMTPTTIDKLVVAKLRKLGIVPSDTCSDGEFLRRVSLDIAGVLPTATEAADFLADESPGKREKKIDELLERPAYAAWWATKLCDLTGNNPQNMEETAFRNEQAQQWYRWTYARIQENLPYDELVSRMLLSVGREDRESYDDYASEMSSYVRKEQPADFADRETMPHYWSRSTFRAPADRALGVAYAFLGIRIQCAQCHKHPFDQWTQQDFQQFTHFFRNVSYNVSKESREAYDRMQVDLGLKGMPGGDARKLMTELGRQGKSVPFREVYVTPVSKSKKTEKLGPAENTTVGKLLAAEEIDLTKIADPRVPVVEWLRRKDNAWFARSFVNRVWAHYFHAGIVNPPDDLNLANPPSNRELLDNLAQGFVDSGFDMKWLHREITNSRTYQLSWRPNDTNLMDQRNFSRAIPRRLPAEVAYDAIVRATSTAEKQESFSKDPSVCAISHASVTSSASRYAMGVFGKPARETTCDCERAAAATLLQSVYLQNDRDVLTMIDRGGWLSELGRVAKTNKKIDTKEWIRDAYLRTVTRLPTTSEIDEGCAYLSEAKSPVDGMRDLMWTLLNTKEFVVNH